MQLSTKGRYGLRAICELAIRQGKESPVSLKSIAESQNISENYLEQLFAQLKKGGLVKSYRGTHGGYHLAKEPQEITAGDVIQILEGPIGITECTAKNAAFRCDEAEECRLLPLFEKISEKMTEAFDSVTIADLIREG